MKNVISPLSKKMISKLHYCRKLELDGKLCSLRHFKDSLGALYHRGYVEFKKAVINGKEIIVVFVTSAGLNCLEYSHQN